MDDSDIEAFNKGILDEICHLDLDLKNGLDSEECGNRVASIVEKYSDVCSKISYEEIIKKSSDKLEKHHQVMADFYVKLEKRWGNAVNLLEQYWLLSIDYGQTLSNDYFETAEKEEDVVYFTLKELHGRACRITGEIISLLRNGYPDGAMARWRTLYEILVISDFIKKNGHETARRYLEFERIEEYQTIENYQKNAKKINKKPLTEEEVLNIKRAIQPLKEKYNDLIYMPREGP